MNVLRRVEPQTVEVKFVNPVARVGQHVVANPGRSLAVEVDGGAPVGMAVPIEVGVRELREVVAVGTEVIVDDVEDDPDAKGVRAVDEAAKVVRRAVEMRGGEEIHAVVTPAEATGKVADGHHLHQGYPQAGELRKLRHGGGPGPFVAEGADVHLVDDLPGGYHSFPGRVGPVEGRGVHHQGGAVRSRRLRARGGVGVQIRATVEPDAVERAGPGRADALGKVPPRLRRADVGRPCPGAAFEHDLDAFALGGPDAEVHRSLADEFGADGHAPRAALIRHEHSPGGSSRGGPRSWSSAPARKESAPGGAPDMPEMDRPREGP